MLNLGSALLFNVGDAFTDLLPDKGLKVKHPFLPAKFGELISKTIQRLVELFAQLSIAVVEIRMQVRIVHGRASGVGVVVQLVNHKLGVLKEVVPET